MKSLIHCLTAHVFHWLLIGLILAQCLLIGVLLFGDIGFDHAGKYGLAYQHLIRIYVAYGITFVLGIAIAIGLREWPLLKLQLVIPTGVTIGARLYQSWRMQPLDPADYQHLIGMTSAEVRAELGSRMCIAGHTGGRELESYSGMTLYYGKDRRVEAVEESRVFRGMDE